jgi:DegV family protein with EDD domain
MKRVVNGKEIGELYDSEEEVDRFYEELKSGALPTTCQLNSYELQEFFESILKKEKEGDIIHIPLSSGLSGTCENARAAAEEINKKISGRKIYVVDSLTGTGAMAHLIEKLIVMRDNGYENKDAIAKIEDIRDHQQAWIIVGNLSHLKRGGRISGFKAAIGTLLNVKPIIILSKNGRLVVENTIKGPRKAISYVLNKVCELGVNVRPDFYNNPVRLVSTSKSQLDDEFKAAFKQKFPKAIIQESRVGPIIGTHLGDGCALILFEGASRLDL